MNSAASAFVGRHTSHIELPEPPAALSFDEARRQLDDFHNNVGSGQTTFEHYFSTTQKGNKTLKEYVSNTDQQSQSVQGLMRASQEARNKQIAHNNALIQGTAAAKASQAAMKGLALAGNILAPMLLGAAVSQVAGWIDDMVHRSDKLIAKAEEAKQTVSGISDGLDSARKLAAEAPESYSALFSGVDPLTNENRSLSTEDYERYLDICSRLAETFPELIKGYDSENNAILDLGANAEEAAGKLEELYRQKQLAANLQIAAQLPDLYAGYQEKTDRLNAEQETLEEDIAKQRAAESASIVFSNRMLAVSDELPNADEIRSELYSLMEACSIDLSTATLEKRENENGVMTTYLEGFLLTDAQLTDFQAALPGYREKVLDSYKSSLDRMEKEKQALEDQKKAEWQSIVPALLSSMAVEETYAGISEEAMAAVRQIVTGLDPSQLPEDACGRRSSAIRS